MADLDDAELGAIFFTGLIEDEVRSGRMTLIDKSDEDLEEEFRELAAAIVGESPRYIHHVDHQPRLLEEADRYRNAAQYELAITLYATWVEHWLNSMILWAATKKGFETEDSTAVYLRAPNMSQKYGAIWRLLVDEPFPKELARRVGELVEARNAFIHYKWIGSDVDSDSDEVEKTRLGKLTADAPSMISELEVLEDRLVFAGRRASIARVVRSMSTVDAVETRD